MPIVGILEDGGIFCKPKDEKKEIEPNFSEWWF